MCAIIYRQANYSNNNDNSRSRRQCLSFTPSAVVVLSDISGIDLILKRVIEKKTQRIFLVFFEFC